VASRLSLVWRSSTRQSAGRNLAWCSRFAQSMRSKGIQQTIIERPPGLSKPRAGAPQDTMRNLSFGSGWTRSVSQARSQCQGHWHPGLAELIQSQLGGCYSAKSLVNHFAQAARTRRRKIFLRSRKGILYFLIRFSAWLPPPSIPVMLFPGLAGAGEG
jgi:hypothetical protein